MPRRGVLGNSVSCGACSRKLSARGEVVGGLSRPLLREELNPLLYREQPSLDPSARWGAEYLDLVLLRCGLDLFHVRRFFWWKCSCLRWLAYGTVEVFVLGSGDDEIPCGFGVNLEGVYHPSWDVNERTRRCRRGLTFIQVERKLSFKDVERFVVLPVNVKRSAFTSGSKLLDEGEPTAGLLGGGLDGPEGAEAPEPLPIFGSKGLWGRVDVHMLLLSPASQ